MTLDWQGSAKRSHADVIKEFLDPAGAKVIDIGCGAGHITRALTRMGAEVVGIDPGERQLERARSAEPVGGEVYLKGIAEDLPFENQTIDIVLFFNSFHHVPKAGFSAAIEESERVLKPGGKLYFAEPIADGPQFELSRLINDETEIRNLAYISIQKAAEKGFKALSEFTYITENRHKDFESFKTNSTSINPARDAIFEQHDAEIRKIFEGLSIKDKGDYVFNHPIRGNLFQRL
jgi:ubiquinone/menaquinone biosynthesis C-methylase UbiE